MVSLFLAACNGTDFGLDGSSTLADPVGTASEPGPSDSNDEGAEQAGPPVPAPEEFVEIVSNAYFPLSPGMLRIYEGDEDGEFRRDEVQVLDKTRLIAGVDCTSVHQDVFIAGELVEVTEEWFAQDDQGNVWKFGEESLEFEDGGVVVDAWLAGEDGAEPWMFMAAMPQVGDVYFGDEDVYEVVSITELAVVPVGTFADSVKVEENAADPDDTDIIIYSPGAGMVSEESVEGKIELVEIR